MGEDEHGQLGNGDAQPAEDAEGPAIAAAVVDLRDAVEIVAGSEHACARRATGAVVCWGRNAEGQLGLGGALVADEDHRVDFRDAPAAVAGVTDSVGLAAGDQHTCARLRGGAMRCWGAHRAAPAAGARYEPTVPSEVLGTSDVVEIAAGGAHTCVRRATGEVHCWGNNSTGELAVANGYTGPQVRPAEVDGIGDVVEVVAGASVTCARQSSGPVRCWGMGYNGVIGDGTNGRRPRPGAAVVDLPDAIGLSATDAHLCAARRDGTVSCWGRMDLHVGEAPSRNRPARVDGVQGAVEVSTGMTHDCARLASGRVLCWGNNSAGQLGNGGVAPSALPVTVRGLADAAQITTANGISCAVRRGGTVLCWGHHVFGAADGVPATVPGLGDAVEVRVGEHLACARRRSGRVLCWLHSRYGEASRARAGDSRFRREITGLSDAVELRMGGSGACALRATGTVVCWGANGQGQLGTGEAGPAQENPVPVVGLTEVRGLALGEEHACAWTATGRVACWGAERGQLGSGVILDADAPMPVVGLGAER